MLFSIITQRADALSGNCDTAHRLGRPALALAMCGNADRAEALAAVPREGLGFGALAIAIGLGWRLGAGASAIAFLAAWVLGTLSFAGLGLAMSLVALTRGRRRRSGARLARDDRGRVGCALPGRAGVRGAPPRARPAHRGLDRRGRRRGAA